MRYLTNAWIGSLLLILIFHLSMTFIYLDWWWFIESKGSRALFVILSVVLYLIAVTCPAWRKNIYGR